jgi:hypothetical protein
VLERKRETRKIHRNESLSGEIKKEESKDRKTERMKERKRGRTTP